MTASIRTTQVHPPSKSGESRVVLRTMAFVACGALLVIASRSLGSRSDGALGERDLLPFQRLFRSVDPAAPPTAPEAAPPPQRYIVEAIRGAKRSEETVR